MYVGVKFVWYVIGVKIYPAIASVACLCVCVCVCVCACVVCYRYDFYQALLLSFPSLELTTVFTTLLSNTEHHKDLLTQLARQYSLNLK